MRTKNKTSRVSPGRERGLVEVDGKSFLFTEFIYGSIAFNYKTSDFPDSVLADVWDEKERQNHALGPGY